MRLPFWAAKVLQKKNAAAIKLPRHFEYKGKFRQQLGLDPSRVNLKEKDPHFFLRSLQLFPPSPALPPALSSLLPSVLPPLPFSPSRPVLLSSVLP